MKTFSYRARNKQGGMVEGTLEAADRLSALEQLRRRELIPLDINVDLRSAQSERVWAILRQNKKKIGIACALVISIVVYFVTMHVVHPATAQQVAKGKKTHLVAQKKVKTTTNAVVHIDKMPNKKIVETAVVRKVTKAPMIRAVPTNKTVRISFGPPPLLDEQGKEIAREPAFKTDTEIALASLVSTPVGVEPIPLMPPDETDEDGKSTLKTDVENTMTNVLVIQQDDTAEVALVKENVAWGKVDIKEWIKQGRSPKEYLTTLYQQIKGDNEEHVKITAAIEDVYKLQGKEAAQALIKQANDILKTDNRPLINEGEIFEEQEANEPPLK
jgi:hypothetical protein